MSTANLNYIRQAVRDAMNAVKERTWSFDREEVAKAEEVWDKLDDIFKFLGPFEEED